MIQPPHECAVRRAFPAITQRGRGWLANGFNYHSDRNAGWRLCAPHSSARDGLTSSRRVLLSPGLGPTGQRGSAWGVGAKAMVRVLPEAAGG